MVWMLLLAAVLVIQFFFQLGGIGLVGPDEPRYAQIAREMAGSGDYVTPRLFGEPWFEKPVLYYWGAALAFKLLGVTEFAARLVSALAALAGVGMTYLLGRHWLSPRAGWLAALILATSPLYFALARAASMDMLLCGTLCMAWGALYLWIFQAPPSEPGHTRRFPWQLALFYASLALSILAKGPVGLVLVGGTFLIFVAVTRQWRLLAGVRLLEGALLVLAIAGPWFWLCYRANGFVFLQQFVIEHNLQRFATNRYQHLQPYWFYLAVGFAGFFPWVLHIVPAARTYWQQGWRGTECRGAQRFYLWLWVLLPVLFFTAAQSKLPGYILPVAPALALLIAAEFEGALDAKRRGAPHRWFLFPALLQAALLILVGLLFPVISGRLPLSLGVLVPLLAGLLAVIGVAGALFLFLGQVKRLAATYVTGVVLAVLAVTQLGLPLLDAQESQRQLAAVLRRNGYGGQTVYLVGLPRRVEYGLDYYLKAKTKPVYANEEWQRAADREFFVVTPLVSAPPEGNGKFKIVSAQTFAGKQVVRMISLGPH